MARAVKRGTSIAEFLLSLGLLAIIILAVVELGTTALRGNEKGGLVVTADTVAQQDLETFVYGLPAAGDPFWASTTTYANPYQVDNVTLGTSTFHRTLTVLSLESVTPGLRQIAVNVTWWGGQGGHSGYGEQSTGVSRLAASP